MNNKFVDCRKICGLFPDFQFGFSSSRSFAHILTIVFDKIIERDFYIYKGFKHAVLLHKCRLGIWSFFIFFH